nr:ParB/Srx family N-terminal domain-containing protein [Paenibacillus thiaminolyticus]
MLGGGKAEDGEGRGGSQDYKITHIPVHKLEPSQDNFYCTEQIEELKASIAAFGIKQNLIVKPIEGGKYRVIAGHRRRLAILSLVEEGNLKRCPASSKAKKTNFVKNYCSLLLIPRQGS